MPQRRTHSPRRLHEAWILEHLRRHGRASRAELVTATGLSRATVSALTGELMARQQVVVAEAAGTPGRAGRTPQSLALNPSAGLVLGLDFAHSRVAVVAADAAHVIVGSATRPYPPQTPWDVRCAIAVRLARKVLATAGGAPGLAAVGIGIAGSITGRPTVVDAIEEAFTGAFGAPLRTDNNARLAGLAESVWGAAKGVPDALYVRLSSGVGGAVLLDARVHRGRGAAGEFGHVCLDPAGPLCRCGNRGCLECYVGVETVLADAGSRTLADLAAALDRGDGRAHHVVTAAGQRIGLVLAGAGNVLDVPHAVLGGDLTALGEHLVRPVRQALHRHLHPDKADSATVATAELGDLDGALGGVALVLHDPSITFTGPLPPRHLTGTA